MEKGRPAPISSFGAGQGDNNISRLFEDKKDQLQFYPLEAGRVFFLARLPLTSGQGAHVFAGVKLDSGVKGGV